MNYPKNRLFWTDEQIKLLKNNIGTMTRKDFAILLNKSEDQIRAKALSLALSSKDIFIKEKRSIEGYLDASDFAKKNFFHVATVRYWIRNEQIESIKIAKKSFIPINAKKKKRTKKTLKQLQEEKSKRTKIMRKKSRLKTFLKSFDRDKKRTISKDLLERIYNIVEGIEA